jgi:hypothetical protein
LVKLTLDLEENVDYTDPFSCCFEVAKVYNFPLELSRHHHLTNPGMYLTKNDINRI